MSYLQGNALGSCACSPCSALVNDIQCVLAQAPWTGWLPLSVVDTGLIEDWYADWPLSVNNDAFSSEKYLKRTIYIELGDYYNGDFWMKRETTIAKYSNTFVDVYTTNYAGDQIYHPDAVNATNYGLVGEQPWWGETGPNWSGYIPPVSGYENQDAITLTDSTKTRLVATGVKPASPIGIYLLKIEIKFEVVNKYTDARDKSFEGLSQIQLLDAVTEYDWGTGKFRFGYGYQSGGLPALYNHAAAILEPTWAPGETYATAQPNGTAWSLCPIWEVANYPLAAKGSFYTRGSLALYVDNTGPLPADIWASNYIAEGHLANVASVKCALKTTRQLDQRTISEFDKPNLQYGAIDDGVDGRGPGEFLFDPSDVADFQELNITQCDLGTHAAPTLASAQNTLSSSSEPNSQ
jgi:hypothetical protein